MGKTKKAVWVLIFWAALASQSVAQQQMFTREEVAEIVMSAERYMTGQRIQIEILNDQTGYLLREIAAQKTAIEALQEAWREKKLSMDELWRYAHICKVENIIRPYVESLS